MDLSTLAVKDTSVLEITHPVTEEVIEGMSIEFYGPTSDVVRKMTHKKTQAALNVNVCHLHRIPVATKLHKTTSFRSLPVTYSYSKNLNVAQFVCRAVLKQLHLFILSSILKILIIA